MNRVNHHPITVTLPTRTHEELNELETKLIRKKSSLIVEAVHKLALENRIDVAEKKIEKT